MVDTLTRSERSRRMSLIRSSNTSPELAIRKALHRQGFRYRLDVRSLPGRPDIVLPRYNVAIFVHGCFWHRHEGCKIATVPKSNTPFWLGKFQRNVDRDIRVRSQLEAQGWRVIVVWECELNTTKKMAETALHLGMAIREGT